MIGELMEFRDVLRARSLTRDELWSLRERKLRAVVRHAYENVPYYRSLFDSAGLSVGDIRGVEDLGKIPVTTKEALRGAGLERITSVGADLSTCIKRHTSGSTGRPFTAYLSLSDLRARRLVEFRTLLSTGFRPLDRLAVLGPQHPHGTRLHQRLGLYRSLNISARLPFEEQIRRIKGMRPTVFWAYPTALWAVMQKVDYRLSRLVRPRTLIVGAEYLDDMKRERIVSDTDVEIFNFYGANETGRIAAECPAHEGLHVNMDHVILECLDGDRPAGPGRPGVAVLTALNVFTMPFIRYRLGDVCTFLEKECSCGSPFPLIAPPLGREREVIKLPSGNILSPWGVHFILRKYFEMIDHWRFIQETGDHLVLLLVLGGKRDKDRLAEMRREIMEYLGEPVTLDVEAVDSIPEEKQKFRTFVSKLPRSHLDPDFNKDLR